MLDQGRTPKVVMVQRDSLLLTYAANPVVALALVWRNLSRTPLWHTSFRNR
jgi:hypothetical protein